MLTVQQLDDNRLNSKLLIHIDAKRSVRTRNDNWCRRAGRLLLYCPGRQAAAACAQLNNKTMRGLMALEGGVLQVKGGHFKPR